MDYLDFDIEIGPRTEPFEARRYPVRVLGSPAGEAAAEVAFPLNEIGIARALDKLQIALLRAGGRSRRALSPEEKAVQDFGKALFGMLLNGPVLRCYDQSFQKAETQGKGLRLKLRVLAPELALLPWEFVFDERQNDYLTLSAHTPLVRYVPVTQPPQPLTLAGPLRVLGLIASPKDLRQLDVEREQDLVTRSLQPLVDAGRVELQWRTGVTWRDLQAALRQGPWHVVHFIGHGDFDAARAEGRIILEKAETHTAHYLGATELARLLRDHRHTLRLAVLNACLGAYNDERDLFSSTAATLLQNGGLAAVLAMQYEISDPAAIELARTFYESLAEGLPVDAALAEARKAISIDLAHSLEWDTPVLFMRAVDGRLFEVERLETGRLEIERRAAEAQREVAEKAKRAAEWVTLTQPFPCDLRRIPAGAFLMGSEPDETLAWEAEKPQHSVLVSEYLIAKTPVTVAQWAVFAQTTQYQTTAEKHGSSYAWTGNEWKEIKGANWAHPLGPQSDVTQKQNHPTGHISWNDACEFCYWLNNTRAVMQLPTGWRFRLPTEAEWEKAARGIDGNFWPWGNVEPDNTYCNFNMNVKDTTPVGQCSFQGDSSYGLQDMAGNVWEWCWDGWDDKAYVKRHTQSVRDPYLATASARVLRGGSFSNEVQYVRCAYRNGYHPTPRNHNLGFRICASPLHLARL